MHVKLLYQVLFLQIYFGFCHEVNMSFRENIKKTGIFIVALYVDILYTSKILCGNVFCTFIKSFFLSSQWVFLFTLCFDCFRYLKWPNYFFTTCGVIGFRWQFLKTVCLKIVNTKDLKQQTITRLILNFIKYKIAQTLTAGYSQLPKTLHEFHFSQTIPRLIGVLVRWIPYKLRILGKQKKKQNALTCRHII